MGMNFRIRKLFFLLLGMMIVFKITLTVLPLLSAKGLWTTSLRQAEAAGGSASISKAEEGPNKEGEIDDKDKEKDPSKRMKMLEMRELEMKKREEALRLEEERLNALKRDIVEKLNRLQQANEKLEAFLLEKTKLIEQKEKKQLQEEERIKQLARIFESTPPEQAGNLLGKLETRTAAKILLQMNGRKAGKIWGFVKPDRAVKISKELSKMK
jgi:flagellar motility protein MotE (MotC chaperone)